jgi:hypothetical protein
MNYCFDTSVINNLYNDPDRDFLIKGLVSTNTIEITAVNVVEILATKDMERRQALINFAKMLSKGKSPIALPDELIETIFNAHKMNISPNVFAIDTNHEQILRGFKSLASLSNLERKEWCQWKTCLEKDFQNFFDEGTRNEFQKLFSKNGIKRPRSALKLIRDHHLKDFDFIHHCVSPLYEKATGVNLAEEETKELLDKNPEIALFLLGFAYANYSRNIQQLNYGKRKKAGVLDLWSAVYLFYCDYFITHDKDHWKALRVVNAFNPRKTRVLSYETFKSRLLLF